MLERKKIFLKAMLEYFEMRGVQEWNEKFYTKKNIDFQCHALEKWKITLEKLIVLFLTPSILKYSKRAFRNMFCFVLA